LEFVPTQLQPKYFAKEKDLHNTFINTALDKLIPADMSDNEQFLFVPESDHPVGQDKKTHFFK
jgi:hypothetical protein